MPTKDGEDLPSWVGEHATPWADLAGQAWRRVLRADDASLLRSFAACSLETHWSGLEAPTLTSLRERLLAMDDAENPPLNQLPLLFSLGYELDPVAGSPLLLAALDAPIHAFNHQDVHDGILQSAALRLFDETALWPHVFTPALTFTTPRDSNLYFSIGAGLAKSRLFPDPACLERVEGYLHEKAQSTVAPGEPPNEKKFLHILMIALLYRSPAFKDPVARFAERYLALLQEKGQAIWTSLFKQEMEAVLRKTGR